MAVEAHHLHLFPSQIIRSREAINSTVEIHSGVYNTQMGVAAPESGNGLFLPFYNSAAAAAASDSGVTFNNQSTTTAAVSLPRKRSRNQETMPSFLGEDISSHARQQMQDVDRLIVHHAEKVRAELAERRRRFWAQALAAVEEGVSKRLKAKEEEIERIGRLNWALEERVRSLFVENQIWRDLAQTNEAAANVLRANLEQVLEAQVRVKEEQRCEAAAEDAESCCCGGDDNREEDEERHGTAAAKDGMKRVCRNCGEREPSVLLLPCRHLCLCAACCPAVNSCPICKCSKDGSVVVNIV